MKETYEVPVVEIILIDGTDIITGSPNYPAEPDPA